MNEELINQMADEFCRWPLPDSVCADLCATMRDYKHRSGTNLLTVVEAQQMIREVVGPRLTAATSESAALRQRVEKLTDMELYYVAELEHAREAHDALAAQVVSLREAVENVVEHWDCDNISPVGDNGSVACGAVEALRNAALSHTSSLDGKIVVDKAEWGRLQKLSEREFKSL